MLSIKNLSKSFSKTSVLNKISWDVPSGKIVGLVGKNGAGKSTLLRCIAGIYEIDEGQILFLDKDIKDNPNAKQDIFLLSDSPFELKQSNLKQLSEFYQIFYPSFDPLIYRQLIDLFNFDEKKALNRASKGLKRQASLIIALALKPKLLLMDESYDGLDPYVRVDLTQYLRQQFIDDQHTIIISSHNIHELEHLCDEMVILENHQLIEQNNSNELSSQFIKVQLGFNYDLTPKSLDVLNPLDVEQVGRVYTVIVKDEYESFKEKAKELHPALIYQLNLPVQELYLKKIEVKSHEKTV